VVSRHLSSTAQVPGRDRRVAESFWAGALPSQRASDVHGDPRLAEGARWDIRRAADYLGKAYAWTSATLRSDGFGDSPVV
jgi:hypothetical protein